MGGFTCCVPGCYNNSKRERELRFYIFPKDPIEREKWLKNISRAGCFQPTTGHRVCSVHFAGGRKTYSIRIPTLFPQRGEERHGRKGKKVFAPVPTGLTITTNVVSLSANVVSLSAADTEAAAIAAAAEGDIVTNTTGTVEIVVEMDENGDYVHYVDDAGEETLPILTPTLRTSS